MKRPPEELHREPTLGLPDLNCRVQANALIHPRLEEEVLINAVLFTCVNEDSNDLSVEHPRRNLEPRIDWFTF